ncbi:MAG TPA: AMP-binding protein [Pseudonocardiaceae bacterium]
MSLTSIPLDPLVHPDRQGVRPTTGEHARFSTAETLGGALVARRLAEPEAVAYYVLDGPSDEPVRLTVADLFDHAAAVAGALASAGTRTGDRVGLCLDTSADLLGALFGTVLLGAIPFLAEPPLTMGRRHVWTERMRHMVGIATPRAVLCEPRLAELAGEAVDGLPTTVLCPPTGVAPPADVAAGPNTARADDVALLQFSSGTTSDAKAVVLTHRALFAAVRAIGQATPLLADDVVAGWLPLHHDMGLVGMTLTPFLHGFPAVLLPPLSFALRPERWLRMMHRFRATVSPAPNFGYRLCVDTMRPDSLDGLDLSSWRVAYNGAEVIEPATIAAWQDMMGRHGFAPSTMRPCYGMAEVGLAIAFSPPGEPPALLPCSRAGLSGRGELVPPTSAADRTDLVSCGRPVPGTRLRIVDADGRDLPDRTIGSILVASESMMSGYLGRSTDTSAALVDGWLRTGDLGAVVDGELFVTGRAKDLVIIAGRNYHPYAFERAATTVPEVRAGRVAAVGVPDRRGTEALVLVVETAAFRDPERAAAVEAAVERAVSAQTGVRPDRVYTVRPGTLPRTPSGKLQRPMLAAMVADGRLGTSA